MEKVNINTAEEKDLIKIIHIGEVRAKLIYTNRIWYKIDFKDIYELSTILGLGQKRMKDIIEQGIATV